MRRQNVAERLDRNGRNAGRIDIFMKHQLYFRSDLSVEGWNKEISRFRLQDEVI